MDLITLFPYTVLIILVVVSRDVFSFLKNLQYRVLDIIFSTSYACFIIIFFIRYISALFILSNDEMFTYSIDLARIMLYSDYHFQITTFVIICKASEGFWNPPQSEFATYFQVMYYLLKYIDYEYFNLTILAELIFLLFLLKKNYIDVPYMVQLVSLGLSLYTFKQFNYDFNFKDLLLTSFKYLLIPILNTIGCFIYGYYQYLSVNSFFYSLKSEAGNTFKGERNILLIIFLYSKNGSAKIKEFFIILVVNLSIFIVSELFYTELLRIYSYLSIFVLSFLLSILLYFQGGSLSEIKYFSNSLSLFFSMLTFYSIFSLY